MVREVYFFTEMGYTAYSQAEARRYGYNNLMFPNEQFSPERAQQLYAMYFDELQYASETGIDDEGRRREERRLELLLALAVRTDCGDEDAGWDVGRHHERATSGRTRHAHVALTEGGPQVRRRLHAQLEARRGAGGHAFRALGIGVEDPRALQGQDRGNRRELELSLDAAADDRGRSRVASGEERGGDGRGGCGPERGHAAGFDDGQGHARARIREYDRSLDGREPETSRIVREIGVGLGREVAALADEAGRLDVEPAADRGHAKNSRAQGTALGMEAEGALHRADAGGKRQEIEHVTTREDDEPIGEPGHGSRPQGAIGCRAERGERARELDRGFHPTGQDPTTQANEGDPDRVAAPVRRSELPLQGL